MRLAFRLFFLFSTYIAGLVSYATEVDSFTNRDLPLADSKRQIDALVNGYFESALKLANKKGSCEPEIITNALIKQFKKPFWSLVEEHIFEDEGIDKRHILFRDSIYRDFNLIEAPAMHVAELGPIIRVGDFYVGTDKIGHFLQTGYEMFVVHQENGGDFSVAQQWSEWTERSYYGLWTTGVYAYGDLAANYDGLYFWERVADVYLPTWEKPYFQCQNGVWSQNVPFSILDYANEAWDESYNCSDYRTSSMKDKVEKRIAELEQVSGKSLSCPVEPKVCKNMLERYGNVAPHLITPKCF